MGVMGSVWSMLINIDCVTNHFVKTVVRIGRRSSTLLGSHLDISRCCEVAKFCPLVLKLFCILLLSHVTAVTRYGRFCPLDWRQNRLRPLVSRVDIIDRIGERIDYRPFCHLLSIEASGHRWPPVTLEGDIQPSRWRICWHDGYWVMSYNDVDSTLVYLKADTLACLLVDDAVLASWGWAIVDAQSEIWGADSVTDVAAWACCQRWGDGVATKPASFCLLIVARPSLQTSRHTSLSAAMSRADRPVSGISSAVAWRGRKTFHLATTGAAALVKLKVEEANGLETF